MDKRIGKFFLACLLLILPVLGNVSFNMALYDMNGNQVNQVGAEESFLLEVSIMSDSAITGTPQVEHLNKYFYTGGGVQKGMQYINGRTFATNKYSYQMRFDRPGTYEIGPVVLEQGRKTHKSQPYVITVARDAVSHNSSSGVCEAMINISTNKRDPYLYEQIMLKLRIYIRGSVQNIRPQLPTTKGFSVGEPIGPMSGVTTLNGKEWEYHEIDMAIYPQRTGNLNIPSAHCVYAVSSKARNQMEAILQAFGGQQMIDKQMSSNELNLEVHSLPSHRPATKHVGQVSQFDVTVNQRKASQGDAIVLKMVIAGNVDMNKVDLKPKGLPKQIQSYHSNSSQGKMKKNGYQQKTCEYILQGLEPGTYTIPTQKFTFFNSKEKQYQTVTSKPIKLEISKLVAQPLLAVQEQSGVGEFIFEVPDTVAVVERISTTRLLFWYWMMIILIGLSVISFFFYAWGTDCYTRNYLMIRKRLALLQLKRSLRRAQKNGAVSQLHGFFIEYISAVTLRKPSEVGIADVDMFIQALALTEKQVAAWKIFYDEITQAAFSKEKAEFAKKSVTKKLFEQAQGWVALLSKRKKS